MSPRRRRGSATRRWILIDQGVRVLPKSPGSDAWRTGERSPGSVSRDEHPLSQGNQFAHRHAITRDDERLALVQGAHDSPAVVAELALGDSPTHRWSLSHLRYALRFTLEARQPLGRRRERCSDDCVKKTLRDGSQESRRSTSSSFHTSRRRRRRNRLATKAITANPRVAIQSAEAPVTTGTQIVHS